MLPILNQKEVREMLEEMMKPLYSLDNYNELIDNILYLDYMKKNYSFKEVNINVGLGYKYQGNFYGLLNELSTINSNLYLYTLYVNGYTSPDQYDGTKLTILVPTKPPIPNG